MKLQIHPILEVWNSVPEKEAGTKPEFSWFSALASTINILLVISTSACTLTPRLRNQVESDLLLSDKIYGRNASPLHRKIFGDSHLDGKLYRHFFNHRVKSILGEGIGFASCHGAIACNFGETIRISDQYQNIHLPPIIRLSILLHEARHSEGWTHEKCPSPLLDEHGNSVLSPYQKANLDGELACDLQELGPYGIQIIMLTNISQFCEVCTQKEKTEARQFSDFLMTLIISKQAKTLLNQDCKFLTQPMIDPHTN